MKQLSPMIATQLTSSADSNSVGTVFCMTVDQNHSHENSGQSSVCTLATFVDELALSHRTLSKHKIVHKPKKNVAYWSPQDINQLVKMLRTYGCDFQSIATKLNKTRDQVKRKFKVLEKKNPALAEVIFERAPTEKKMQVEFQEEDDFFRSEE